MPSSTPPVVLYGYDSSPFTQKIRLVLKLKQIPYFFVTVSSQMPRPALQNNFHLTYRKIPVLTIGNELYVDTSLITEALEHCFSDGYPSIYPPAADGRSYRPIMRGFASYWIDRPFFRVTTGLIPGSVWRTDFGVDRSDLIGHKLDPDKLAARVPQNLSALDMNLSILEPLFRSEGPWIFSTSQPSMGDITLYYQLSWGIDIAAGRGIHNLTGGGTQDTDTEGASTVFNATRYPGLHQWFVAMQDYFAKLPSTETKASPEQAIQYMKSYTASNPLALLLPTATTAQLELDHANGLLQGAMVTVVPDDTGRGAPVIGTLLEIGTEEVAIKPRKLGPSAPPVDIRVHFPRVGFVIRPYRESSKV